MSLIVRLLWSLTKATAQMRSRIPVYELSDNGITLSFEKPSKENNLENYRKYYENCAIKIKGAINLIELNLDDYEVENLKAETEYTTFMRQNIIEQIFAAGYSDMQLLKYLSVGNIIALVVGILVLINVLG